VRRFFPLRAAFTVAATLLSASVLAQPPHRRGPPPEATQACASKSRGEACTVTLPDRQLEGTCESRDGEALACRPAHPPGPPPEALTACSGLQEGAACTVTFPDHQLQGQCHTGPDQQLACRPEHGHRGPPPR
jgi:hypothetical protein